MINEGVGSFTRPWLLSQVQVCRPKSPDDKGGRSDGAGDNAAKERQASGLQRVERFLMALANRRPVEASIELSEEATYVVPGRSWVAGTFTGREEILRHFEQTFDFAVDVNALKWVDWKIGTNLVAAVLDRHLRCDSKIQRSPSGAEVGVRRRCAMPERVDLSEGHI